MGEFKYFLSYAHEDKDFVLKLAKELRAVNVNLWLDQLDILGGQHWDRAVAGALKACQGMIVILSPESVVSDNVMDEISYALGEKKLVLPVLLSPCDIPYRLRRVQHIDFTADYNTGFSNLLKALRIEPSSQQPTSPEPTTHKIPATEVRPLEGLVPWLSKAETRSRIEEEEKIQKIEFESKLKSKNEQLWNMMVQIIAEQLGVDESEIVKDASFIDDLGADSLDLVELLMAFEEKFNVEISDEEEKEVAKLLTVGEAYQYGVRKLSL